MNEQTLNQKIKSKRNKKSIIYTIFIFVFLILFGLISSRIISLFRSPIEQITPLSESSVPPSSTSFEDITLESSFDDSLDLDNLEDEQQKEIPNTINPGRQNVNRLAVIQPPTSTNIPITTPTVSTPSPSIPQSPDTIVIPNQPTLPIPISITSTLDQCDVVCAKINTTVSSGNQAILERGIVYDINPAPTTIDTKIIHSGNQMSYTSEIQNMRMVDTYYIRPYVITPSGTIYGNQLIINKTLSIPNNSEPTDLSEIFANLEGEGTARSPYIITNDWELQAMSQDLDAHYRLGNNIDARGTENWNEGKGFTPIGTSIFFSGSGIPSTNDGFFTGNFDGNGYGILGLTIDRSGEIVVDGFNFYVGLFSRTDGAKLYNIVLQDNYILGRGLVGGITGYIDGETEIRNAFVDGVAWAKQGRHSGGLVGYMQNGLIDNSFTNGQVGGNNDLIIELNDFMGGLVGQMDNGTITSSTSNANVTGSGIIGGIVGEIRSGTIENSCANGHINQETSSDWDIGDGFLGYNSGGFVGSMRGGTIRNSYATGNVTIDNERAGGFVGLMSGSNSSIMSSYATGDVFIGGARWGGGFVGEMRDVNPIIGGESMTPISIADITIEPAETGIHNSYAKGDVIFTNYGIDEGFFAADTNIIPFTPELFASFGESFGGFVGENENSIMSNNYSTGRVIYDSPGFTNPTNKGFFGIYTEGGFGTEEMDLINTNNYWDINTSQQSSSAGNAIGLTTSQMYQQSSFNSWNFNTVWQSNGMSYPTLRNSADCKFTCFKPTPVIPLPPLPPQPIACTSASITSGLIQYLDTCSSSYTEEGTDIWRDLTSNAFDIQLDPTIGYDNSNGGSLIFNNSTSNLFSEIFDIEEPLVDFTSMTWVKPTTSDGDNRLHYLESYDDFDYFSSDLYLNPEGSLNLYTYTETYDSLIDDWDFIDYEYNLNIELEMDKWYHIAISNTLDDPIKVYINGELVFTAPDNHSINLSNPPYNIYSEFISRGNLASILLYDRSLSSVEIQQSFDATQSRFDTLIGNIIELP